MLHTSDSIAISLHKVYFVISSLKCKFIKWVSKVIRRCFVFALLRSVIGLKNWRHSLNQSDAKLKQTRVDRGRFPRLRQFACFTCSSHWGGGSFLHELSRDVLPSIVWEINETYVSGKIFLTSTDLKPVIDSSGRVWKQVLKWHLWFRRGVRM